MCPLGAPDTRHRDTIHSKYMKIGVVILNYNGWKDTITCAQSVLQSSEAPEWIIIVDNASTDDSVKNLLHWGATQSPPLTEVLNCNDQNEHGWAQGKLVLLRNLSNNGYAGGNNAGIRLLMGWGADAIWILNNDTMVNPGALKALVNRLFSKERPGLCGACILYMGTNTIQCCGGGKTSVWSGLSYLHSHKQHIKAAAYVLPEEVERKINFIYGACVLVSREFIETVGLMDERYFLYCEEQDWAFSAKGRFDFAYAQDAVVYHKEGSTTGISSSTKNIKSLYYLTRSRILLTAKHHPWALPTVFLGICFAGLRMLWRQMRTKAGISN